MRVAIVAESFLPNINGVTNSVLRILEHLSATGHEAIVVAPGARDGQEEVPDYLGFPIYRVPTVRVPLVDSLPIGVPTTAVDEAIRQFQPDLVHLASPFVLGAAGAFVARQQRIPAVAAYQTDVAGFATKYQLSALAHAAWDWTRTIHNSCQMTLAPSSLTIADLREHGIRDVYHWGRGVDACRFHPANRSETLRRQWGIGRAGGPRHAVGFVGRLAAEKGVHRLAALNDRRDLQLVIVGDGPERPALEAALPGAQFMGALGGEELARAYASLDVFVHPGEFETFCQTIQEAQASGVPTIGPRAGGPVDLIEPGHNGLLLEVDSFARDLPQAVDALLVPAAHPRLRAQARASVESKTWLALCEQLLGYYEQVLGGMRQPAPGEAGHRPGLPRWAARALGTRVA